MTPQVISLSSLGSTAWIPVDYKQNPFNIGLACVVSDTPNLTYQVEFTLDDIFNTSITPTAFAHSLLVGKTSDFSSNQTTPVRAIRLTTTAYTSGTVTLTALQGGVNPIIYTPNPVALYQSGIPFWLPPGDGGANGLSFTGTRGVFTLSAAAPMANSVAFLRNCYCYLPAGAGGLATGGWFWCEMSDDTNGEIFQQTYSGRGNPAFVSSPTAHPDLAAGRITQTLLAVTASSFTIPGGSMGPNGILYCSMATRYTNSATTKSFRAVLPLGSFMYLSGTTSNGVIDAEGWLQNQGVQNKQTRITGNAGRAHSGTTTMATGDNSQTVQDFSVDVLFTTTMQIGATTDSIIGVLRKVLVEYGA